MVCLQAGRLASSTKRQWARQGSGVPSLFLEQPLAASDAAHPGCRRKAAAKGGRGSGGGSGGGGGEPPPNLHATQSRYQRNRADLSLSPRCTVQGGSTAWFARAVVDLGGLFEAARPRLVGRRCRGACDGCGGVHAGRVPVRPPTRRAVPLAGAAARADGRASKLLRLVNAAEDAWGADAAARHANILFVCIAKVGYAARPVAFPTEAALPVLDSCQSLTRARWPAGPTASGAAVTEVWPRPATPSCVCHRVPPRKARR